MRTIRVIAGSARGRRLVVPAGDAVRPTKDVVREAMFNALDARGCCVDAVVLDLFAGSGALALEALSRGASRAVVVERDRRALEAIRENVRRTGTEDAVRIVDSDVDAFLRRSPPPEAPFTLVLLDPPYGFPEEHPDAIIHAIAAPGWLAPGAVVVLERGVAHAGEAPARVGITWERTFGDTLVQFLET